MGDTYERKGLEPVKITVQEGGEKAFDEFPGLKREELDAVNDFYKHYLFFQRAGKTGRRFWSSCCHQAGRLLQLSDLRAVSPEDWNALRGSHGWEAQCPFCGKPVTLKAKGTAGKCKNLETYIPVVFLSAADQGETVYAQAYWTGKNYDRNWSAEPLYNAVSVYRFRKGEAVQWEHSWYGAWSKQVNGFLSEPFRSGGGLYFRYEDYQVLGMECLGESFLKYIDFTGTRNAYGRGWNGLLKFLGLAAQYPENVEMLQKAGMTDVLDDWTRRKKKNAANIVWGEKDPRKAFRLDNGELKAFMATRQRSLRVMTLYKRAKKQKAGMTMQECQELMDGLGWSAEKELPKLTRAYGVTMRELVRYLRRQADDTRTLEMAFRVWKDYLAAAEGMGLGLYRGDVKFPKDLWTAHEAVTARNRRRLERERRKEDQLRKDAQEERERMAKLAYAERKQELEKRYGYGADGFVIRAPESREEIVAEGKALQHCVGGYADRHMAGSVTILFLRKESAPDKPFLTVEMNGSELVQIHGYRNEGLYTGKGRFAPDPREVYSEFLDPWLRWVAGGSRRNKKGQPVMPRSRKQKMEVQIA